MKAQQTAGRFRFSRNFSRTILHFAEKIQHFSRQKSTKRNTALGFNNVFG
ncbi:hypothetical protein [Chitinophaga caseinilytica]|uniref:Uncharacterized protein n=1 Tax=Chitinophaga caseinilytica TaxID=2267521 RepID=A0ABZ2ZBI1_9BACT